MFQTGDSFPGDAHRDRIKRYSEHRRLMRGMYDAAMAIDASLDLLGTSDYLRGVKGDLLRELAGDARVVANLPRTICRRLAGMVNTGLTITAETDQQTQMIDDALQASRWGQRKRQAVFRAIAYGNGILSTRRNNDGLVIVDQRDPWTWFPEADPYDPSMVKQHVIAWITTVGEVDYLLQEVHEAGRIYRTAHELQRLQVRDENEPLRDAKLAGQVSWADVLGEDAPEEESITGVDLPLVASLQSWTDEDSVYGEGLLAGNETLIYECTSRLSQIATILDKHADPKLSGPESALNKDPNTGRVRFDVRGSRYFQRESKDDPAYEYLTWESQLEHAHQELDRVITLLCVQMDMSPELLGLDTGRSTSAAEATASLRLRSFSTLQAVEDQRAFQRVGLADMARQILSLSGGGADAQIDVKYGDPLPMSNGESVQLVQAQRMAGLVSMETAIRRLNPDMTDEQIDAEIERIRAEESAMYNPGQA